MEENKTTPKRQKKPNRFLRLLALLATSALVLLAMVLVIYRDTINVDTFKHWLAYRNMDTGTTGETDPFSHAGGDKLSIAYLDSGIVTASAAGAHYYTLDGEHLAEEVLSMENPVLTSSRTTAVVYDAGNQSLFAFRNSQEYFSLSLNGGADLLSARPNDGGWLAVTAQQSGYKGAVTVYDRRGEPVIQISLSSTFAVDAAISPDCKSVAVVTMGQEEGSFFSRLLLFRVNQTEPFAQVDLGSLTVLDLEYEGGFLWILGEDRLLIVDPQKAEAQSYTFAPNYLKGCSLDGDGFALLLTGRYRSGSAEQALVVDSSAQVVQAIALTGQVLDYAAAGEYCALLTGSQLSVYNTSLEFVAGVENSRAARRVDLNTNGSALLANDQQAWLYIP
mgnify:CR=1 FL=1